VQAAGVAAAGGTRMNGPKQVLCMLRLVYRSLASVRVANCAFQQCRRAAAPRGAGGDDRQRAWQGPGCTLHMLQPHRYPCHIAQRTQLHPRSASTLSDIAKLLPSRYHLALF